MRPSDREWVKRSLIAASALVGVWLLAQLAISLSTLWVLVFGAIVVAVILRSLADPIEKHTPLNSAGATFAALLIVVALLGLAGFLFGSTITQQVAALGLQLPQGAEELQQRIRAMPYGALMLDNASQITDQASRALALAPRFALNVASAVTTLLLVVVAGVFLASKPVEARDGVLSMFPKSRRARLREVMNRCGAALRGWLKAQLVSMILVGTLTGLGLWALGVPSPMALGLLTGLAQFVPIVGPIVSTIPAVLVAGIAGLDTALWTLLLYVVVSQLEANLITPLVQRNVASLPIVLGVFAVVGIGLLFGPAGVLFATPLALVLYTIVTELYRRDVLHDETATSPGDPKPGKEPRSQSAPAGSAAERPARPAAASAEPPPTGEPLPAASRPD